MKRKQTDDISKEIADELWQLWFNYWTFYKAWYQGKIKMSAISKEKIKMRVLTKIQDIWTEWPDVLINVTVVFMNIYIEKPAGGAAVHRNKQNKYRGIIEHAAP
jgi:hypothetical protein